MEFFLAKTFMKIPLNLTQIPVILRIVNLPVATIESHCTQVREMFIEFKENIKRSIQVWIPVKKKLVSCLS